MNDNSGDNVIPLATHPDYEEKDIPRFLRAWADAIENDSETANAAVLILRKDEGPNFALSCFRCNAKLIEQIGMMHAALHDICNKVETD